MWHVLRDLGEVDSDLTQSNRHLLEETTRVQIMAIGLVYLVCHLVATLNGSDLVRWNTWLVTLAFVTNFALTLMVLPRRFLLAQFMWQIGLVTVVTFAIYVFQWPQLAIFYVLLPFLAVISIGWLGGVLVEAMIAGLIWWLAYASTSPMLPPLYGSLIAVAGLVTLIMGWTSTNSLFTVVQWAVASFTQARVNMEEARQHRAQLSQLFKDLDKAYYQLDRANAALTAARKAAEDAEQFKTEFVTNVSHELRTPLNLIVGFSEMMMLSPESYNGQRLPGPYRSDLGAIYHSAQHLLALVDDVLDLARIEVGKIALARDAVDLAVLVEETCAIVHDYILAKGLELRVQVDSQLAVVWIDRLRVRQVLLNLLVNAARHTTQGWIAVAVEQIEEELVVRVSDTGQGIPEQDLPKIFEEFRTTEHPFSEWHSGTGLGLPISKKFVELHGGRMGVESTLGVGTSFWFTLPASTLERADPPAAQPSRYRPLVRLGTSERIVVVAHPDPTIAPLLARYLDGYRVLGVDTLAEAEVLAHEVQAIAVLLDGNEPTAALRDDLLVIRFALPSSRTVAMELGAKELLVKPVSRQGLLAAIARLEQEVQRVLIVDDDPEVVQLFQRMLRSHPAIHTCMRAYNGEEALALMRQQPPDLVLLDLVMPQVDGHSVLNIMAAEPDLAVIPVILVSARGQDHVNLRLAPSLQIERANGFELGEIVRTLSVALDALAPGWQHLNSNGQARARARVG